MGMLEDALRAYAKFEDRTTDPATPAAGEGLIYVKDGKLHSRDDAGTVVEYGATGGGDGDLTLLDTVTLGSAATEIAFTSIAGTYSDLLIVGRIRTDRASNPTDNARIRVGSGSYDSGTNYRAQWARFGDSAGSGGAGGQTSIYLGDNSAPGATADADGFGSIEVCFFDYTDTARHRQVRWSTSAMFSATVRRFIEGAGSWTDTTNAIDRIRLFPDNGPNFVAGSSLRLYGRT